MTSLLAALMIALAADPIEVVLKKEADKAAVVAKDDPVTVSIHSATGIGSAQLRPAKAGWPKQLRLELHLKGLEGFTISSEKLRVRTALGSEMPEVLQLRDGKWEPVDLDLEVALVIRKDAGRTLVDIPSAWLDPATKELSIEWIDYYR